MARSMLMPPTVAVDEFPARSDTLAEADSPDPLPVTMLGDGQGPSIPDRSSEQVQSTSTSLEYHPPGPAGVTMVPVMVGGVVSTSMSLTVTLELLSAAST